MSSALSEIRKEVKKSILDDYLFGMDMHEIAVKYGFKNVRTVYHHLNPLSKEQKIQRMISKANRMQRELKNESQTQETKAE